MGRRIAWRVAIGLMVLPLQIFWPPSWDRYYLGAAYGVFFAILGGTL